MGNTLDEIKSFQGSTGRKMVSNVLETRKKMILNEMMGECKLVHLANDSLDEYARKKLYAQHLLQIQYSYIELLLSVPQTLLNSEIIAPETTELEKIMGEKLSEFDTQYRL